VERKEEVADLMTVINLIRASALSARDSRELIRRIKNEIDAQWHSDLGNVLL
jgi:hypothetical protein